MAKLYFYYSTMNAGKTTVLLQSAHNYRERGMKPLLFTPALDNRHKTGVIKSRIGLEAEAIAFESEDDLFSRVKQQLEQENIHCVLVDEAQFLTREQVYQLSEVVDRLGIPVLLSARLGGPARRAQNHLPYRKKSHHGRARR